MKDERDHDMNFTYYQSANVDASAVKANFLVRQYEYSVIVGDLLRNPDDTSMQHYLLLGRRGSGKSTLLRRIQAEVETNESLRSRYITVNLAEEQANIYRLFDLLEEIADELHHRQLEIEIPSAPDADDYSRQLMQAIHKVLDKDGRRLVLLLDNIDRIFESLGDEVVLLREYLQNHSDIKIIGGSTKMTEHFWAYDKPFYEFFRVFPLKALSSDEVKELLLHWSDQMNAPQLREFVEKKPGQLETIRILTDGLPRTLLFFVNILLTQEQDSGYDYLRLVMDKVTPLYQERLNNLPPSQRKIVLQLAFCWEAVGAKELAAATRMENRVISAQLSQLIEKGVAEKIPTKTKNHLYRLSERFFNLWLIFTQGSPREKRRARYLSIFLENFYDQEELVEIAKSHRRELEEGKVGADKAVLLTKAYSQSKYVPRWLRDSLIEKTLLLPGLDESLVGQLPKTSTDLLREVQRLGKKRDWMNAFRAAESIEQDDGFKLVLQGALYVGKGESDKALSCFLLSLEKGYEVATAALGDFYIYHLQWDMAEQHYQSGIQKGGIACDISVQGLAHLYYLQKRKKEEALRLLLSVMPERRTPYTKALLPIIQVWNGKFEEVDETVVELVQEKNSFIESTLQGLLVHHQEQAVFDIMVSEEFGRELRDQFITIFLVTCLMVPKVSMDISKVPPEIKETINKFLLGIYTERDAFYGTSEAAAFKGID